MNQDIFQKAILAILLGFAAFAGFVYFVFLPRPVAENSNQIPPPLDIPSRIQEPTNSQVYVTPDPLANKAWHEIFASPEVANISKEGWQIYINKKYGFRMQYPADWGFEISRDETNGETIVFSRTPEDEIVDPRELILNVRKSTPEEYFEDVYLSSEYTALYEHMGINGKDWMLYAPNGTSGMLELLTEKDGFVYLFNDTFSSHKYSIIGAMIKSFKFDH